MFESFELVGLPKRKLCDRLYCGCAQASIMLEALASITCAVHEHRHSSPEHAGRTRGSAIRLVRPRPRLLLLLFLLATRLLDSGTQLKALLR